MDLKQRNKWLLHLNTHSWQDHLFWAGREIEREQMIVDVPTMDQIISNVFDEMLCMPTSPSDSGLECSVVGRIVASIRITGAMEKLIIVEAPMATASLIGETMFDAEHYTLPEEEIRDAVGEIVNMIGGNVKGMCEGESTLSLPCVSVENSELSIPDGGEQTIVNVAGSPILVRWHDMPVATV